MWLPRPRAQVFAFFGDAANLDVITPPWLQFQILTPLPLDMKVGALLDYRLTWHHLPVRWRTEITAWDPPHRFVDEQIRGPYRQWIHLHTFEESNGGTLVRDRVDYAVPGWIWEPLLHRWMVGPDLRRIFAYRQERIQELLGQTSVLVSQNSRWD